MSNNIEELKNENGEVIGTIAGNKITFNGGNTAYIRNGKVYANHKEIGTIGDSKKVTGGVIYKPKKKFNFKKIVAATVGTVGLITVIVLKSNSNGDKDRPIIIPTPTPKPIEDVTITPTITPMVNPNENDDTCKISLASYLVKPGESLTSIVSTFYGDIINEYNITGDKKEYNRVQQKLIEILAAVNKTDPDKIFAGKSIFILSPSEINKTNMYVVFSKNSEYYADNDNCIQFVITKNDEYDPSIETLDGMETKVSGTNQLITYIDSFEVTEDGYFVASAYKYITGKNFNIYEFVKQTYTEPLKSVGITDGATLQQAYNHIVDSIMKLNPSKFSTYSAIQEGDSLVVINPNSINDENYKFVLYTDPVEYNENYNRISYYVYGILQEMNSRNIKQ